MNPSLWLREEKHWIYITPSDHYFIFYVGGVCVFMSLPPHFTTGIIFSFSLESSSYAYTINTMHTKADQNMHLCTYSIYSVYSRVL